MSLSQEFKTQIKNIRREGLELGIATTTMDGYQSIWNKYIEWKNTNSFIYNADEYSKFLLEHYNFDVTTYSNKSKSRHQQLMRSKRILDNWISYKSFMDKRALPKLKYTSYPDNWNPILEDYLDYCKDIRCNAENSIRIKKVYLDRLLSYFYQEKITELNKITSKDINIFISKVIDKGERSKGRYFYILKGFLEYLFIENILSEDLSIYVPSIKKTKNKRIATYLNCNNVEKLLKSIPRNKSIEIRDYAIILLAARLGLRISDILNIKLKDIDWVNYKLNIIQPKIRNLNVLPLSKEIGWALIDYITKSRPKCNNEYLFVKAKYPFDKMAQFKNFNKYFDKTDVENKTNKKGIHTLRHSLATNMLNEDIPVSIIASVLGDSVETTSNTYLKVDIKNLSKCHMEIDE